MTLATHPDFRRTVTVYRDGWTGETRTATYAGRCIGCGVRTYDDSSSNDPRGPMGDHAASPLRPSEYGAAGQDVPACFTCQNDTEARHLRTLRRAERAGSWRYPEPAEPVAECYGCGAAIRLRGTDGGPYLGWAHEPGSVPRLSRVNPRSAPYPEDGHTAYPRNAARPDCRNRAHHFSGSWCDHCAGWA